MRDANSSFSISGYSGNNPSLFQSFPAELRGYVYSNASPYPIVTINYGTEASSGTATTLNSPASAYSTASDFVRFYSAQESTGQLLVSDASTSTSYVLNLPNVYRVAVNPGGTIALAMVRNSDALYRVVKLNANSLAPPGNVDCQPTILPVYCVVPVPGTYDRPVAAQFALDGSNAYILNCGAECGGGTNGGSGVSFIPQGPLEINVVPTAVPYPAVVTQYGQHARGSHGCACRWNEPLRSRPAASAGWPLLGLPDPDQPDHPGAGRSGIDLGRLPHQAALRR